MRNQQQKYIHGYRRYDKVRYRGQECFIHGRRSSGYFALRLLDGTKVHDAAKSTELTLLERSRGLLKERRMAFLPTAEVVGIHA